MIIGESIRTGFIEIYSHKMRSFLSFSAIAFGVAAILYTFAIVNWMYTRRNQAFELAGPGRMEIEKKWRRGESDGPNLSKGLTIQDAEAIRKALPWLHMVSPGIRDGAQFRYRDFEEGVSVRGITSEWRKRNWVYTLKGRFFNELDYESAARVCIVDIPGGWAEEKPWWYKRWGADDKFNSFVTRTELIGRKVMLNDTVFTVIGALINPPRDKDPRWFARNQADVYIPLKTMQRYIKDGENPDSIEEIAVDTGDTDSIARARRRIEGLLRVRHRDEDDFEIHDFRERVQHILNRMRENAIMILSVGIVAILAGGVGIMNVTLATIFSRIREIGVRRAIGATRLDILVQFITEAMILGLLGGLAGVLLGAVGILYLARDGQEQLQHLLAWHYFATVGISIVAGFIFSLYPAYQASKLDPVEALRYE